MNPAQWLHGQEQAHTKAGDDGHLTFGGGREQSFVMSPPWLLRSLVAVSLNPLAGVVVEAAFGDGRRKAKALLPWSNYSFNNSPCTDAMVCAKGRVKRATTPRNAEAPRARFDVPTSIGSIHSSQT